MDALSKMGIRKKNIRRKSKQHRIRRSIETIISRQMPARDERKLGRGRLLRRN